MIFLFLAGDGGSAEEASKLGLGSGKIKHRERGDVHSTTDALKRGLRLFILNALVSPVGGQHLNKTSVSCERCQVKWGLLRGVLCVDVGTRTNKDIRQNFVPTP